MSRLLLNIALILALCAASNAYGVTKKADPQIPLKNALEALRSQNFTESLSWLGFVKRDFPKTEKSSQALALSCTILLSRELASLKILNLYSDSKELLISKEEKEKAKHYEEVFDDFRERAYESARLLRSEVKRLLQAEEDNFAGEFSVSFKIGTDGWNVSDLRHSVQKGKMLDKKDIKKLFKGEMLTNFMGFLTEVLSPTPVDALEGNFRGMISKDRFYRAIGGRLLINAKRDPSDKAFSEVARKCFERVLKLTDKNPYSKERRLAMRGINELKTIDSPITSLQKCPVCGRALRSDWLYCPYDGTRLKKTKK